MDEALERVGRWAHKPCDRIRLVAHSYPIVDWCLPRMCPISSPTLSLQRWHRSSSTQLALDSCSTMNVSNLLFLPCAHLANYSVPVRSVVNGHLAWTAQNVTGNHGDNFCVLKLAELQPYTMLHPNKETAMFSMLGLQGEEKAGRQGMQTVSLALQSPYISKLTLHRS